MSIYKKISIIILFLTLSLGLALAQSDAKRLPDLLTITNMEKPALILNNSLPKTGKVLLIFYDPGCGHCQKLGEGIANNLAKFAHMQLYFISMNDKAYVDGFVDMFAPALKGKKNISFWKDEKAEFITKIQPNNYPATYLYELPSRKLIQAFDGEGDVRQLLKSMP